MKCIVQVREVCTGLTCWRLFLRSLVNVRPDFANLLGGGLANFGHVAAGIYSNRMKAPQ